ncbi:MAG: glycosyltransferase family 1 protein [Acidocella sp.]|nr:glycosyltransferase family 1 protein [Acidocella sp.]
MSLWFDVDDLIRYFATSARPTGIQRLSFELFRQLSRSASPAGPIMFCRRLASPPYFRRVDFSALEVRVTVQMQAPAAAPALPPPAEQRRTGWLGGHARRLPYRTRRSLQMIIHALRTIKWALVDLAQAATSRRHGLHGVDQFDTGAPVTFTSGDWLVNLGSSWNLPYESAALKALHGQGAHLAVLVCDLIPQLFPEWSTHETLQEFRLWLHQTLPRADMLLAISHNTAADLAHDLTPRCHVLPQIGIFPMGCLSPPNANASPAPARPFVLLVATLEVRKNHALMFRVWQRLLAQYGASAVPDLVFAGKRGWLIDDFLTQMQNAAWLDGKIRFVESPSDSELALLYQQCLFTVYPSLYEGWGLPVTESLSFGKTVAASNRASIPEAGGDFCVYFDPENIAQAEKVIAGLIMQPARVAALEAHIAANFQPPHWAESAAALIKLLTHDAQAAALASQPAIDVAA